MAQPVQNVQNSTSYFSKLSEYSGPLLSWGGRAVKCLPAVPLYVAVKAIEVGQMAHTTLGTIPGVGVGVLAFTTGMALAVTEGKKAYNEYRDIEILDGTWGGVLKHGAKAGVGVVLAALGAVTTVICVQSRMSNSAETKVPDANQTKATLTANATLSNTTLANHTLPTSSLADQSEVEKSLSNATPIEFPISSGAESTFAFAPMPLMIAGPDYPAHESVNDTCPLRE